MFRFDSQTKPAWTHLPSTRTITFPQTSEYIIWTRVIPNGPIAVAQEKKESTNLASRAKGPGPNPTTTVIINLTFTTESHSNLILRHELETST